MNEATAQSVALRILVTFAIIDGAAVEETPAAADGPAPGDGLEGVVNDLTAIQGIGITMQDRLCPVVWEGRRREAPPYPDR